MALVRQYGPLEDAGPCQHPSPCDKEAVARVPNPAGIGSAGLDLCPFHLALWADCRGDRETLRKFDVADLAADDRWLSLEAVPLRLNREAIWHRLGVDHRGLAHFYHHGRTETEANWLVTVDRRLEFVDAYQVPAHIGLDGWIDHVDECRAWVALDEDSLHDAPEVGSE